MKLYDPKNRLVIACFEASRAWHNHEKNIHKKISSNQKLDQSDFRNFLKYWQVSRNSLKISREKFPDRLHEIYEKYENLGLRKKIFKNDIEFLWNEGFTNRRATSLVSKYLFCCNPRRFSPYDQYTLKALNALGANINVADYTKFMSAFEAFHSYLDDLMDKEDLCSEIFSYNDKKIKKSLFSRRVADKYLMLIGGYGDNRMVENIKKEHEKFRSKTLDKFCFVLRPC